MNVPMLEAYGAPRPAGRIGQLARRRLALGAAVFALTFLPALVFLWTLPQIYQASATLAAPGAGGDGADLNAAPPLDAVTQQVLSSGQLAKTVAGLGVVAPGSAGQSPERVAALVRPNVTITKNQDESNPNGPLMLGFSVSYRAWNAATAATVANRLARSYQRTASAMRLARASQNAAALAASMAVLQKKLRGQRAALEKFNSAHLGELPQQQQLNLAALDHLYERLQGDQAAELDAMNRRADLLARSGGSGGGKLAALKQKLQALRLHYTDQYPDVVNLRREIAALESSGAGDAAAPGASPSQGQLAQINARLSDLRSDESAVQKQIAAARGKLERLPLTNQRIEALSEGDSQTSGVYSALLTQYEEARVVMATAGKDGSPYVMLEPARAPRTSEGPKRLRFAVMLLVVCAVLAFAAMLLAERRDTTFHTLEELREFTSVPILATIPVINRRRDRLGRFLRVGALVAIVVCAVVILGGVGYVAGHGNQPVAAILAGGTHG